MGTVPQQVPTPRLRAHKIKNAKRHAAVHHAPRVAKVAMKVATKGSIYSLLPMMERKTL